MNEMLLTELEKLFSAEESELAAIKNLLGGQNEQYNLLIKVEGENFDLSFPSPFAESLNRIQQNFYRSVAFSLHGDDNIRKLTAEELKTYEIVFSLRSGCTEFFTNLPDRLFTLVEKVMEGMSAQEKARFFTRLVIIVTGGITLVSLVDTVSESLTKKAQEETKQILAREETKRLEAAIETPRRNLPQSDDIIEHFEKTTADSEQAVLKGAKNADKVIFRNKTFDKDDIEEANQRASRAPQTSKIIEGEYWIVIINTRDSNIVRLTLADRSGNEISTALDTTELNADQINHFWRAAREHKPLKLSINAAFSGENLKQAYITDIALP